MWSKRDIRERESELGADKPNTYMKTAKMQGEGETGKQDLNLPSQFQPGKVSGFYSCNEKL